ncbi:hypothetical protein LguiB_000124 [Lonicera macranthoides]
MFRSFNGCLHKVVDFVQVKKLGRESFFILRESFRFNKSSFGKLSDKVVTTKPMVVSKSISYVF